MQEQFHAFIESVCAKYGCQKAKAALQEGFAALCESEWTEESYRMAHQSDEPELCGEPAPVRINADAKPVEYCRGCGQPMYRSGYLNVDGLCPECLGRDAPDYYVEGLRCAHCRAEAGVDFDYDNPDYKKGMCPECGQSFKG